MRFAQQTQFVESVNDVEEADKRDSATFDRLEVFKKTNEVVREAAAKQKKFEQQKGFVRDAPANSGKTPHTNVAGGNYYIYIGSDEDEDDNTNYEGKEKISLAALQEEVLNTFLEVKKKNRKMEEKQNEVAEEVRVSVLEKSDSKLLSVGSNDTIHITKKF